MWNYVRYSYEKTAKIRNSKWTSLKMDVTAKNATATGHIRTWMQPLMDARAHERNRSWMVQKMNDTALVYHRRWT